jgi:TRAP-type C4-dicarboxylate transport system permease small subunit
MDALAASIFLAIVNNATMNICVLYKIFQQYFFNAGDWTQGHT